MIYVGLFLYGLIVSASSNANFVPTNTEDDLLHLVLGLGMVAIGYVAGKERVAERPAI